MSDYVTLADLREQLAKDRRKKKKVKKEKKKNLDWKKGVSNMYENFYG